MIFSCDRVSLSEAISTVQKAVASHSNMTVLEGILIKTDGNKIILTGNNLEIGIECVIEASVDKEGAVVVNSRLFGDIINKFSGDIVTFNCVENNLLNLKCGNSKFKITGISPDDFPEIQRSVTGDNFCITMTQKQIKELIRHTYYATSVSSPNIILSGCYLEAENGAAKMIGVDGHRLALRKINSENISIQSEGQYPSVGVIIPAKSLTELTKVIDDSDEEIRIFVSAKNARFEFSNVLFVCRTIEGDFIDYNKIIPTENITTVKVSGKELLYAVERASLVIINEIGKSPMVLDIADGEIKIDCETNAGHVKELIPVDMVGENVKIGFNNRYLLDALKAVDSDEITMSFNGGMKPCLITPVSGDAYKYLVLPLML